MPRYARIHVPGALVHMISRFHNHEPHLDEPGAREMYLRLLGQAASRFDARVISYCLMSTHVHLVLQLGTHRLGGFSKAVHSPFANWLNLTRRGLGAVLADRPKSVIVHSESYGLELLRYVHNNPVRAGLVARAKESGWSSHRAYLGLDEPPSWLSVEAVLGSENGQQKSLAREFDEYVDEGRLEPRRPELSGEISRDLSRRLRALMGSTGELSCPILGPDDFVVQSLRAEVTQSQLRRPVSADIEVIQVANIVFDALGLDPALASKQSRPRCVSRARALVAWLWIESLGRPQVEVARAFKVHSAAVCRMLAKLRATGFSDNESKILDDALHALSGAADGCEGPSDESSAETRPDNDLKVFLLKRSSHRSD